MSLVSLIAFLRYRKREKYNTIIIFLIYSITSYIGVFPIANSGHFIEYAFIGVMETLFITHIALSRLIESKKTKLFFNSFINNFVYIFLTVYFIWNSFSLIKSYKNNYIYSKDINHYQGVLIDKEVAEQINAIDEYIIMNKEDGKKVIVLDSTATMYMIPIDIYNKDYDLFNKGNFGRNGEKRLINQIDQEKDVKYLVLQDIYTKNWQTPTDIINYVKDNKTKTGEILVFDIYE